MTFKRFQRIKLLDSNTNSIPSYADLFQNPRNRFSNQIRRGWKSTRSPTSRITTDCWGSLWAIYGDGDDRQRDIRKPDSGGSSATLLEEQSTYTEGAGRITSIPQ
ncbi:hypothetical protein ALC62_09715 [Cyphomyrmex costatus]|uniref:Uncharacterized protein n=1 Tax=Cyphomyrmex costatus TaxID=456900 RepID=A0A151IF18_9HYME|nr:hypothetical protein ALC62_09715 [Cyphomyrmex costatus]